MGVVFTENRVFRVLFNRSYSRAEIYLTIVFKKFCFHARVLFIISSTLGYILIQSINILYNILVARVMNPEPDIDLMDYTEAVQACADQGSSIATPSDLADAKNAGMDTCACGWISVGDNGGIAPLSGTCTNFNSTNEIEYCSNAKAIAWCKLN